ncbi:MAG: hypothetical protein KDK74_05135 [Cephaloticoccus sp.]|nr:hypothetical protein [Cephaloticoccus sp.]
MNPPRTPGEMLLEEVLKPMGISQNAMARAINEIVLGKRSITPARQRKTGRQRKKGQAEKKGQRKKGKKKGSGQEKRVRY